MSKRIGQLRFVLISGLISLGLVTAAEAAVPPPCGWYVEANAGQSKVIGKDYPGGEASVTGFGYGAAAGYKFMPYLATEAQYTNYYRTNIQTPSGTTAGQDKHYSYGLAAKGIFPFSDTGFELFAKVGIARLNSNEVSTNDAAATSIGWTPSSHVATGVYFGIGADYYLFPQLAVNVQAARANGNSQTGDLDLYSGGINFIFD